MGTQETMSLRDVMNYVAVIMQSKGHNYYEVTEYMWTLFLQSPSKLEAYLQVEPDHFIRSFIAWRENKVARDFELRQIWEARL